MGAQGAGQTSEARLKAQPGVALRPEPRSASLRHHWKTAMKLPSKITTLALAALLAAGVDVEIKLQ